MRAALAATAMLAGGFAAMIGIIVLCVRTGSAMGKFGFVKRAEQPVFFWMFTGFWAFAAFSAGLVAVAFVIDDVMALI